MRRLWIAVLLARLGLAATLQLEAINGSQKVPLAKGSTYSLGQIPQGVTATATILAMNTGPAAFTITKLALSGGGFMIVHTSSPPYVVAPGSEITITVQFRADAGTGGYSAALDVTTDDGSTTGVLLMAQAVAAVTLASAAPCSGPDANGRVDFGNIAEENSVTCAFVLTNSSSAELSVGSVKVSGTGFVLTPPSTPMSLPAGGSSQPFTIVFSPQTAASYSGSLTVDAAIYTLAGTAYVPPVPAPMLQFDTSTPQSGQQITLTMTLPQTSPVTATGYVTMSFQPDSSAAGAAHQDLPSFINGGAQVTAFAIPQGQTGASFGGKSTVVLQTPTTSGTITFTVTLNAGLQMAGNPTVKLTLPPAPVAVDKAVATAIAGQLRVQVWGFDNTYSAGPMSFTFYDVSGKPIGAGPVTADFSSSFHDYFFNTSTDGGSFAMLVTFPVSGNAAEVGSVEVQMTNSVAVTKISGLTFLNDTGQCVLVNDTLTCPPAATQ